MAEVPGARLIADVADVADVATHVSPMSRLKTWLRQEGFEPATFRLEGGCSVH